MIIKCPCLNCSYVVEVEEGYFHYTEKQAMDKMLLHLKNHSIPVIWEWIERCMVEYFINTKKEAKP